MIPEEDCHYASRSSGLTPAAVLIGLVSSKEKAQDQTEFEILLTKRTAHLHHHPGQISLPGGRREKGDKNPVHTAVRETIEETGIAAELIDVIGVLDEYPTTTGFRVMPVVARIKPGFVLQPDEFEVEQVFSVPLRFILDEGNQQRHEYKKLNIADPGTERTGFYYQFDYQDKQIWGVTAGILINFYKRLRGNHPLFCELMPQMSQQGLRIPEK